jgi:DNA-binding transcriptional MerR regulator
VTTPLPPRLLSIGEFAAATQLSAKALRLYDEHALLPPARIDRTTGYRYYRNDQVSRGRLIRTFREMGLSLADIATLVSLEETAAGRLLGELAREQDYRYAREKRAYRAALLQMQHARFTELPQIVERRRQALTIACREFVADADTFAERYRAEAATVKQLAREAGLRPAAAFCRLVDPLCEDEGRLEAIVSVDASARLLAGLSLRELPAATCAVLGIEARHAHAADFAGALDAMFDWFDRRGSSAIDAPLLALQDARGGVTEIIWAFSDAHSPDRRQP